MIEDNKIQKNIKCHFCLSEKEVNFKDIARLQRYINERGMIIPRQKTRLCAKHQRQVSSAIRKARLFALLSVGGRKNTMKV